MKINNKFELQEVVFLITDVEQQQRIITGIQVSENNLLYRLACGVTESWNFEFEIAREKTFMRYEN